MNIPRVICLHLLLTIILFNSSFSQNNNSSPFKIDYGTEALVLGSGAVAGITALAILLNLNPLTQ